VILPAGVFLPSLPASSLGGEALLSIASVSVERQNDAAAQGPWLSWLAAFLFLGAMLRATWLDMGWMRLRQRLTDAPLAEDSRFSAACAALGVRARLVWRMDVSHPFTYGIALPVVVIPADLTAAPDATLRAIFIHELMHVRRRDWRSVIAEEAIRTVLWFHPAMWLLLAELRQAREEVIDRATVRLLGSRRAYLDTLVTLADRDATPRLAPALPFFRSRQLARRIAALASEASMSRLRVVVTSAAVLTASVVGVGAAARAFPLPSVSFNDGSQAASAQPKSQSAVPGPIEQSAQDASAAAPPPRRTRYIAPALATVAVNAHPQFTVRVVIDDSGKVAESRLVSMKAEGLDAAAADAAAEAVMAAVRQWQFERPARAPLAMTVVLTLDASGKGGETPVIEQPVAVNVQAAEYPESARAKKIEGDVAVEATLDANGRVTATKVVKSVSPELDQAAVDAIRASTFRPGMRNGAPVPVTITMTMRFKLE
jgi:TonB family protein